MANITVSTTSNFDDAGNLGLGNGENVTINTTATLTINSDVRWGQNAAVIGDLTINDGVALLDGSTVWWIPYDNPTGNIPALGTCGTDDMTGSITGSAEFLGCWTALGVAPSAAGGAFPATGFIKCRSVSSAFANNETITFTGGGTVDVNSTTGGQTGWISVVGEESGTITVPLLGTFQATGDWFELGLTDGNQDDTFTYPINDVCPCLWIETAAASGVYEKWLNAGSRWNSATKYVATDVRGKYFGQSGATITLALSGANECGKTPAANCKVRIPNILISASTSADWTANLVNSTIGTRWETLTTGGGTVDLDKVSGSGFYCNTSITYDCTITNSGFLHSVIMNYVQHEMYADNISVGLYSTLSPTNCFYAMHLPATHHINDIRAVKYLNATGTQVINVGAYGPTCVASNLVGEMFGNATSTERDGIGYSINTQYCDDVTFTDCTVIGGICYITASPAATVTNLTYADRLYGTTTTTIPQYIVGATGTNLLLDGVSLLAGVTNIHPYSYLMTMTSGSSTKIRNIGTFASPFDCGSANAMGYLISSTDASNLKIQRCFFTNTRTSLFSITTTNVGCYVDNCACDYTDTQAITGTNMHVRSCGYTNSTTGQSGILGTHWATIFTAALTGRVVLICNKPNTASATQCAVTSGETATRKFDGLGSFLCPTLNDECVWTMDYYAKGYTAFENTAPTLTGTNLAGGVAPVYGNITLSYQIDINDGGGFSAYKDLTAANLSGETINEVDGFKLKIKSVTSTGASDNKITCITIPMTTTAAAQQELYTLDEYTYTLTGLQTGTKVAVVTAGTETLLETLTESSGSVAYTYPDTDVGDSVDFKILCAGYEYTSHDTITLTAADVSYTITQSADSAYNAGAAASNITWDGTTHNAQVDAAIVTIDLDDVYNSWITWALTGDNLKYTPAFTAAVGGQLITGSNYITIYYYFNEPTWGITPDDANHVLTVTNGALLGSNAGDVFETVAGKTIRVEFYTPIKTETVGLTNISNMVNLIPDLL